MLSLCRCKPCDFYGQRIGSWIKPIHAPDLQSKETATMKALVKFMAIGLLAAGALAAQAQSPAAAPAAATAPAATPTPAQIRLWASACMTCHGSQGRAQPGMASLAGMDRDAMISKMTNFKTGRAPATIMHHIARGYSDEQIAAIAAHFAALPR